MSSIRISVDGELEAYVKKLSRLGNIDRAAINRNIAEGLRTSVDENFENESSPDGKAWEKTKRGGKVLTKTGRLRNSIHARSSDAGAEVGTNTVYAATHQFGASGRTIRAKKTPFLSFQMNGSWIRKKQVAVDIPARPYLGISPEDEEEIKSIIEEAFE